MNNVDLDNMITYIAKYQDAQRQLKPYHAIIKSVAERIMNRQAESASIHWNTYTPEKGVTVELYSPRYGHNDSRTSYGEVCVTVDDIQQYLKMPKLKVDEHGYVFDDEGNRLGMLDK